LTIYQINAEFLNIKDPVEIEKIDEKVGKFCGIMIDWIEEIEFCDDFDRILDCLLKDLGRSLIRRLIIFRMG